ncbi:Phosphatidylinositol 3-kinase, nodule isoform [Smittium culicis]|uniref:Phosphatidylinositol 3-kinase VPS34 n=1 Tax=Smittium culicis TaxID=133412 RepID=A0A1R1Y0H9_9FUNG|nr:Phosphatidylinositol 3-kinase, nodule isoform [Smittium culicis]
MISNQDLCYVYDPEIDSENLSESKYRKLIRGNFHEPSEKSLKPNAKTRDKLLEIIGYPPSKHMSDQEKNLVWKYRYFLKSNSNAIGRFVQSVDWSDPTESKPSLELLSQWSDIGIEHALELFIPQISQNSSAVWTYAISILAQSSDSVLLLYLLQLVQAIRYEPLQNNKHNNIPTHSSSSNQFDSAISPENSNHVNKKSIQLGELSLFLINRSIKNSELCTRFYWFLMVECESKIYGKLYGLVAYNLMNKMKLTKHGKIERDTLRRQGELILKLSRISKDISKSKDPRSKKIETLRNFLSDKSNGLEEFEPLAHPLNPRKIVTGIIPERAIVFKSAMSPLLLVFKVVDGSEFTIIYKCGDDMRQDQLVLQIIDVMNNLFLKENLDLKLTCYRVLSTGIDQGMSEFIQSNSLSAVLAENSNSVSNYLKNCWSNLSNSSNSSELNDSTIMENYVKSCAGYCVITYILGVGDRHLDNLLITNSGKLFHVDFGYILGNDPKPFPPPIKLCKEMVEAMNFSTKNIQTMQKEYPTNALSSNSRMFSNSPLNDSSLSTTSSSANQKHQQLINTSKLYDQFKSNCFISYSLLRKIENSNLIVSLFNLMAKSGLPDISDEPDRAIMFIENRLRLDLNDEMATQFLQNTINDSISALFPQVMETIHKWAQYWRN